MDEVGRDEVRVGGDDSGDEEEEDEEVVDRVLEIGEGEEEDGADDGDRQEYVASRGDEVVMSSSALGRLSRA